MASLLELLPTIARVLEGRIYEHPSGRGRTMVGKGLYMGVEQVNQVIQTVKVIGKSPNNERIPPVRLLNPNTRIFPEDSEKPENHITPGGMLMIDETGGTVTVVDKEGRVKVETIGLPGVGE